MTTPRAISMKNIDLKIQLNIQLREATYERWNRETRLNDRELYKSKLGMVAELHVA